MTAPVSSDEELDHDPEVVLGNNHHVIMPRSILKSRRSEESLSPLSDDCIHGVNVQDQDIKPILKQRDSSRDEGYHSSKLRDKSRSPSRGITSPPDNVNEAVVFSGSSGVSTPLSSSNRRSSLTFSPKKSSTTEDHENNGSPVRKASFVSKTTVFLEPDNRKKSLNLDMATVERVKFDSSSLPASPTLEEVSLPSIGGGILKRKGSMGSARPKPELTGSGNALNTVESAGNASVTRRSVLKKDSSYDDTLRPILKNNPMYQSSETVSILPPASTSKLNESASSTSSEDLENIIDANNRGFVDVVIDPVPPNPEDSSSDDQVLIPSPRKSSLGPRLPVIPPSSVKITPDGNLAYKLEALSGQAEAKLKQMAEAEQQQQQNSSKVQAEKR